MQHQIDDTYRLLKIIEKDNLISQRKIANTSGFSLGKVNYILKSLIEKGIIKLENFTKSNNKLGYRYILTSKGFSEKIEITKTFLKRKEDEYIRLKTEIEDLKVEVKRY